MRRFFLILLCILYCSASYGQVFQADRVFDGTDMHEDWLVVVEGNKITAVGPQNVTTLPRGAEIISLPGMTLLPGLIEGHAHVLLHPYNETSWNDQVLKESEALRVVRATVHVKKTLMAGFTTIRDLGSEGAGYADVGIKQAINQGIIPGPRMLVAGRAIVATGSYGPKGFAPQVKVPLGAEVADGQDDLIRVVRDQIGHGADFIKVYADYRWGPNGEAMPTFSQEELELIVRTARSSGRATVAHAATAEGMRRATLAGVETIEHGDGGTLEVFQLMAEKEVALCPTLAAGDAIMQYRGWNKSREAAPQRIVNKRASFKLALQAGVTISAGGDVGVFPHGDNVRELEMMVEYGMLPLAVLQSATSVNAQLFHVEDKVGRIQVGLLADLIAVEGDPSQDIRTLRNLRMIMKDGQFFLKP
ncbi:MAG: amidohydrolase family protein [Bacteroidota bacterium]